MPLTGVDPKKLMLPEQHRNMMGHRHRRHKRDR